MPIDNVLNINTLHTNFQSKTRLLKRRNSTARVLAFEDLLIYRNAMIPVIGENSIDVVPLSNILFIQAFGDKSIIYRKQGKKLWSAESLSHWIKNIDQKYFTLTHDSYLVNKRSVSEILEDTKQVRVGQIRVPIGENHWQDIANRLVS